MRSWDYSTDIHLAASSPIPLLGKWLNCIKGQGDLVGIKMNLLESQHWTMWGMSRFRHSGISPSPQERARLLPRVGKGLAAFAWTKLCSWFSFHRSRVIGVLISRECGPRPPPAVYVHPLTSCFLEIALPALPLLTSHMATDPAGPAVVLEQSACTPAGSQRLYHPLWDL